MRQFGKAWRSAGIILLLSLCGQVAWAAGVRPRLIGMKIYEYGQDLPALFTQWRTLGINTAFIGPALAENKEFMNLARENDVATYIIVPIFYNPEELATHPELYAITGRGQRAENEWVQFVCPNRSEYRRQRIEYIKNLVRTIRPTGISLDFIRYFAYWEKIYPEAKPDPLDNTCFCPSCLEQCQQELHFIIPKKLTSVSAQAEWIMAQHGRTWMDWKCRVIASMVEAIVRAVKEVDQKILFNAHIVPWRQGDFANGIRTIVGQDIRAFARWVDYLSPMCYHHMVKRPPAWVQEVTVDMAQQATIPIIPSIQVKEEYIPAVLPVAEFAAALKESLSPPAAGVVFWFWDTLAESEAKLQTVQQIIAEKTGQQKQAGAVDSAQ